MKTRGFRAAWQWRRLFWSRAAPGVRGAVALALLPSLFFLPLERIPIFGEQLRGVAVLTWFFSLSLALSLRPGPGLRDEALIWPYQKGIALGEMALEDWILDLGVFGSASLWWASLGVLSMGPSGPSPISLWVALFALGVATAALAHSVTLALSALGVRRPSDLTILLALLSLLAPVLVLRAPGWVLGLADLLLPPFRAAIELHGAVRGVDAEGIVGLLFHLLAFSGIALWIGHRRLSAWRPRA
ncbi:MAG: hypothetical protein ACWGSQ_02110 [Longimicrobiales bacterium]